MSFKSQLKSLFGIKKRKKPRSKLKTKKNQTIPIYRMESPEKIVETKVVPIKMPSIVDISDRLSNITRGIEDIKTDMISKTWFNKENGNFNPINLKLNQIIDNLNDLTDLTKQLSNNLSNFFKVSGPSAKINYQFKSKGTSDKIIEVLSQENKLTYTELKDLIKISDPTLSKYLKELLQKNLIKKEKRGRSVFYSK